MSASVLQCQQSVAQIVAHLIAFSLHQWCDPIEWLLWFPCFRLPLLFLFTRYFLIIWGGFRHPTRTAKV